MKHTWLNMAATDFERTEPSPNQVSEVGPVRRFSPSLFKPVRSAHRLSRCTRPTLKIELLQVVAPGIMRMQSGGFPGQEGQMWTEVGQEALPAKNRSGER